jgi:hypothetical protein
MKLCRTFLGWCVSRPAPEATWEPNPGKASAGKYEVVRLSREHGQQELQQLEQDGYVFIRWMDLAWSGDTRAALIQMQKSARGLPANACAFVLLALFACASQLSHAQVLSCASSIANGATFSACSTTAPNSAPIGSTKILFCGNGTTTGASQTACPSAIWQTYSWLQSYSWVLTSYAGWQRVSAVTYGSTPPPPPPPNPPPQPTVTVPAYLQWYAVTQGTDGSAITPAGYRVEYGQGNFSSSMSANATSALITGLASGTWQFRVVTLTATGESVASNSVSFSLPACASAP